ncbi:hypothetical protein CSUB01_10265 [Colletotrichum sublineola]|uniref:Uncharacterized protein n=1 Tax=Colletotrichum sublineola TaxID=1173701 RepID=A0A066XDL1_COLSU|nr:hypothetical protein CSUB01_10265 [Colletotrichum sublineola]
MAPSSRTKGVSVIAISPTIAGSPAAAAAAAAAAASAAAAATLGRDIASAFVGHPWPSQAGAGLAGIDDGRSEVDRPLVVMRQFLAQPVPSPFHRQFAEAPPRERAG